MPLLYSIILPAEDLSPKRLPIDHRGRVGSEYQSASQKPHCAPGKLITGEKKQGKIMRCDVQFFLNISYFLVVLKVFFNVEGKQRQ